MKQFSRLVWIVSFFTIIFGSVENANGKKIHDKLFKYKISIPKTTLQIQDTIGTAEKFYYDTSNQIVLIISGRQSNYKSVREYIDCSNINLEQQLRTSFGDSTLTMISCNKSEYYPEKSTILHFTVSDTATGFNTYIIYFIHSNNEDLQISFNYNKQTETTSVAYINNVMHTFKLL